MEDHRQESIRKAGTWTVPGEGATAGTGDSGGAEGGQAEVGGVGGRRRGADPDR